MMIWTCCAGIRASIEKIPDNAWIPIKYRQAAWDDDERRGACEAEPRVRLASRPRARTQVSEHARAHALKLAAAPPPLSTGLTAWTTRALADHLRQTDGITVSHNYIAAVLREAGIELTPPPTVRKSRRSEPLEVEYEFVVVDGPHARALQQRQTEALLAILRWLREHSC